MKKILIIDDDEQVCKMLFVFLKRKGFLVNTALNGKKGLKIFEKDFHDLVITDLIMPEKEGIETVMELRQMNPLVKIIAISGGGIIAPESYLDIVKEVGANRAFKKPVDFNELLTAIEELTA